jgi:hypothetical protein
MLAYRFVLLAALGLLGCGGSNADFSEPADTGTAPPDTNTSIIALGGACATNGARACQDSKQQLICDGGKWVSNGTCNGDEICDTRVGATFGTCAKPICKAGTSTCDGATLKACAPDQLSYKTSTCASEEHCKQAIGGVCAKCLAWELRCDGAKLLKCAPDRQKMIEVATCESPGLCSPSSGTCLKPFCATNEFRCLGDLLEKCNSERTDYETVKKCPEGTCDAAAKNCRTAG